MSMRQSRGSVVSAYVDSSRIEALTVRDDGTCDAVARLSGGVKVGGADLDGFCVRVSVDPTGVEVTPEGPVCVRARTLVTLPPDAPCVPFRIEDGRRETPPGVGDEGLPPSLVVRAISSTGTPKAGPGAPPTPSPASIVLDSRRVDLDHVGSEIGRDGLRANVSLDGVRVGERNLDGYTLTVSLAGSGPAGPDPTRPLLVRADEANPLVWRSVAGGGLEQVSPELSPAEMERLLRAVSSSHARRPVARPRHMPASSPRADGAAGAASDGGSRAGDHVPPATVRAAAADAGDEPEPDEVSLEDLIAEVMF